MKCKKNPKINLEKKTGLFFQIGLVFAMSVSLFAFEWKSADVITTFTAGENGYISEVDETLPPITIPKNKPVPPPEVIEIVKDDFIIPDDLNIPDVDIEEDELIDIYDNIEEDEEVIDFILVENKPMFLECENTSKAEQSICFQQELMRHIQRNFKYPSIPKEMGVSEKIIVNFVIDKNGEIKNTRVIRGEDKHLKKEAIRLVSLLPKLKPAKQRGKSVPCSFTVPINFKLQ